MSKAIALERIKAVRESGEKVLDLSNLGLTELPSELFSLRKLTHLLLENNQLRSVDDLERLTHLELLDLQGNLLTEIPIFLIDLDLPLLWGKQSYVTQLIQYSVQIIAPAEAQNLILTRALISPRATNQIISQDEIRNLNRVISLDLIQDLKQLLTQDIHLDENLTRSLAQDLDRAREKAIDKDLDLALAVAIALSIALSLVHTTDLKQSEVLKLALEQARKYAINLDQARTIDRARDRVKDKNKIQERIKAQDPTLALELAEDLIKSLNPRSLALELSRDLARARDPKGYTVITIDNVLGRTLDLARTLARARIHKAIQAIDEVLKKISGIYLHDNPIEAPPPPEIIEQGNEAIRTFLMDFVERESLDEVKVILVGEGASGKTSLVNRVLNKSFNKKESQTHGIKIEKHDFSHFDQDFTVNFWDFGGQEIMHATHQFFLTKRCLYILVLDSRKDEKAEYWLNYIQSFGGNAPVIVVLNKHDENPSFDVNRQFLNEKYENIRAYFKVSCLSGYGIQELKKGILEALWHLELRSTAFPKGWLKVKQQMESMTEDYINYAQYKSICKDHHVVRVQSQKVLLDLLNDLGVVLNYEQLSWYDTQVLNPLWLTNAVYRIINSPILAESKGRFNIHDLEAIINDPRYQKDNPDHWKNIFRFWKPEQKLLEVPKEKFLFIVAMMKQFELLFQIDEHHYLIPGLLSEKQQAYHFDSKDLTLHFVIEYVDFLPTAIIPRLMVKLNKYIYQQQIWKTGMVLEEKLLFNSLANIVLDKESRKLLIDIKGERNRDFLTVIRETVKEINSSYQDLDVREWVPLPELHRGEEVLVDYEELLGYESANELQFFSGKLRKRFLVADLLNGIEQPEARQHFHSCRIFLSYSKEDLAFKEELTKHLMPLIRLNKAKLWDESYIEAGDDRNTVLFDELEKADLVLCLISANFIASEFCYTDQLKQALANHQSGTQKVIPIKIKASNWDNLEIARLESLPKEGWIDELSNHESWTLISQQIEQVIDQIKRNK